MLNKDEYIDTQCPLCANDGLDTKCDNMRVYESGAKYCIVHGNINTLDNCTQMWFKKPLEEVFVATEEKSNTSKFEQGEYANIQSRNLNKSTCEFYGYQINREKNIHIANYYNDSGNVVMQQLRTAEKSFPIIGDKKYNKTLYGAHKFSPNKSLFITITEGQIDALSVAQVFDCKYPVVSLPNGVKSAAEVIKRSKKYLSGFKYIVLAFDNDEPGIQATEEVLSLKDFQPGVFRVAKFISYKDANEYLIADAIKGLRDTIYNAVQYLPPSILTGQTLLDTLKGFSAKALDWPWKSLQDKLSPIYVPSVITVAGLPESGKTTMMAAIIGDRIKHGEKVGVISLEESAPHMLLKLTSLLTGIDLKKIKNREITEEEIEQCRETANSIVTYDHKVYGSNIETITENMPYIAKALDCEVIIFDNLSYSVSGDTDEERRAIDKAMIALKDASTKYEFVLFNVLHLNEAEPGKKPSIRGSRGPQMFSDYVIHVSRNVEAENTQERNILWLDIKKDREGGEDTGKKIGLRFNSFTRKLEDL